MFGNSHFRVLCSVLFDLPSSSEAGQVAGQASTRQPLRTAQQTRGCHWKKYVAARDVEASYSKMGANLQRGTTYSLNHDTGTFAMAI